MGLNFTLNDYLASLEISKIPVILVEGKQDKIAIEKLIQKYKEYYQIDKEVIVDVAEDISVGVFSNRERIENIIENINNDPKLVKKRIYGFVDREFREFSWNMGISDNLQCHNVINKIIWSRGHSIENYFFDLHILKKRISYGSVSLLTKSLNLFENVLEDTLRVACAVSITAYEIGKLYKKTRNYERVSSSISPNMININSYLIEFIPQWKEELTKKFDDDLRIAEDFIEKFESYLTITRDASTKYTRWVCHGHVGSKCIASVYKVCLSQGEKSDENDKILLEINNHPKFAELASIWADLSIEKGFEHPKELLQFIFQ